MHAFRCRQCGHLHHAGAAGESKTPHACAACGAGVTFAPRSKVLMQELCKPDLPEAKRIELVAELERLSRPGADPKRLDPDNWEVLAECPHERLAELGLEPHHVEKHAPWPRGHQPSRPPQDLVRQAGESAETEDKTEHQ
jgi:hypothetical protein